MSNTTLPRLPHDPLTPFESDTTPTAAAVRRLQRELYGNARAVRSTLGGGLLGHLGMIMPEEEYVKMSPGNVKFPELKLPTIPTYSKNAETREKQSQMHKANTEAIEKAIILQDHLRALILAAVPNIFIEQLADIALGFGDVTPSKILQHLMDTYGKITPTDLQNNLKQLSTPWNPDTPIETVFNKGEAIRQFAKAGGQPIQDSMYLWQLLETFRKSGVLMEAVREWELKPEEEQGKVDKFCTHFTEANRFRQRNETYLKDQITSQALAATSNQQPSTVRRGRTARGVSDNTTHPSLKGYAYCWTHGICTHSGTHCKKPGTGHKKEATLKQPMGGYMEIYNRKRFQRTTQTATRAVKQKQETAGESSDS
jgi:hypothetical protein